MDSVPESFVPLIQWLRPAHSPQPQEPVVEQVEPEEDSVDDIDDAIGAARRFRATLADAVDAHLGQVLAEIAYDVLARELRLAPCDIDTIVRTAVARYAIEPVAIRVHPDEVEAVTSQWHAVADASLRCGDVVIEARTGSVDARFGTRLARVLARRQVQ